MSPRRDLPVTSAQAALGLLLIAVAVAGVIGLSYALLIPAEVSAEFEAPEEPELADGPLAAQRRCPGPARTGVGDPPAAVTSADLVECPDTFDGQRVSFEGEAVGAVMQRGDHAWIQLNDDPYGLALGPLPAHRLTVGGNAGMAVVIPRSAAPGITAGSFNRHGTGVAVTGTYYKSHALDAGAPAIDADSLEIIRPPRAIQHPVSLPRLIVAAVLGVAAIGLSVAWRRQRLR